MRLLIDAMIFQRRKSPGYESYLLNLLDYFKVHRADLKFKSVIVAVREDQRAHFEKYSDVLIVAPLKIDGYFSLFIKQNSFKRIFGLGKDDVVLHTYNYSSLIPQARSVLVLHDLQFRRYPEYWSRFRYFQRAFFLPISIFLAKRVVAISKFTRSELELFYPFGAHKVSVIYNYCNFSKYDGEVDPGECEKNLNAPFFLSVSSLAPHKNIDCLIRAFASIVEQGFNFKLVLVGSRERAGDSTIKMIEAYNLDDRVVFTGHLPDRCLASLYQLCTAFVSPSKYEGFGIPIAEALYFDKPTLLSDISICREIAGDFALYFHPDRPEELVAAMREVIVHPAPKTNFRSEYVSQAFASEQTSRAYIDLLNSVGGV
jgi:glycosyltransferase involved in cell wall biosynthesis